MMGRILNKRLMVSVADKADQTEVAVDSEAGRKTVMLDQTQLGGAIEGPVNKWTGRPHPYSAKRVRELWAEMQAARKVAATARRNFGSVPEEEVDALVNLVLGHAVNVGAVPKEPKIVDILVIETGDGKRLTFDAESIRLLEVANDALGRMWTQMHHPKSPNRVGPIILKRFEKALEAFDQHQVRRVH
jgi:hypothetical protein